MVAVNAPTIEAIVDTPLLPIRAFPNVNSTRVAVEFSCGKLVSSRRVRIASNEATRADVYISIGQFLYIYDCFIQRQCFISLHKPYIYRLQLITSHIYCSSQSIFSNNSKCDCKDREKFIIHLQNSSRIRDLYFNILVTDLYILRKKFIGKSK